MTGHRFSIAAAGAVLMMAATTGCLPGDRSADAPAASTVNLDQPLRVAEDILAPDYDRDLWPHWSTVRPRCTTREVVLAEQGTDVVVNEECTPIAGRWTSRYDGERFSSPRDLHIDHIVPLADAHRSGGALWSTQRRKAFANDPANLVTVGQAVNREKSDQDPATWLPRKDVCWYVTAWVHMKQRYDLAADIAEARAVAAQLARCQGGDGR